MKVEFLFCKKRAFLSLLLISSCAYLNAQTCACDHSIPLTQNTINGRIMNITPGQRICIQAGARSSLTFLNIIGTPENPITIINCGGQVVLSNTTQYGIKVANSKYFKLTGTGSAAYTYGFKVDGVATAGVGFDELATEFEADHIEITKTVFGGCYVKTEPVCNKPETWRENFVLRNVDLHHFYIHDVGKPGSYAGEGFYIGHSFYGGFKPSNCAQTLYPHLIENLKVHDNRIENTNQDGMQVSCAPTGVEVYNNTIKNYGTDKYYGQNVGIVVGSGSKGKFYNNRIEKGSGAGITLFGLGDVFVYNNLIVEPGQDGIFIDHKGYTDTTLGTHLYNNTIVTAATVGIRMYNAVSRGNTFFNNLIVNPKDWPKFYDYTRGFIYLENQPGKVVQVDTANNYFAKTVEAAKFKDSANLDFHLLANAPAINRGKDLTAKGITFDYDRIARPQGSGFDIGAYEYIFNTPPTASAGTDKTVNLPANSTTLTGTGMDAEGAVTYSWSKVSASSIILTNANTSAVTLTNLVAGTYVLRLTVTDAGGLTATDDVTLIVNAPPVVSAGADQSINSYNTATLTLNGSATDDNGIKAYLWTQQSGPAVILTGTDSSGLVLSNITAAGIYTFRLTATDHLNAPASADVNVFVTQRIEAEFPANSISDVAPTGNAGVRNFAHHSGGKSVMLSVQDKLTLLFNVPAGNYQVHARVRSGAYTVNNSTTPPTYPYDNSKSFWPGSYQFKFNDGAALTELIGDVATISGKDPAYGNSYWGTMKSGTISLGASDKLEIVSISNYAGVDYIEIVPVASGVSLRAGSQPISSFDVEQNETAALTNTLYPNPFRNAFTVELNDQEKNAGHINWAIVDLSGKVIKVAGVSLQKAQANLYIDNLHALKPGSYILQLKTSSAQRSISVRKE